MIIKSDENVPALVAPAETTTAPVSPAADNSCQGEGMFAADAVSILQSIFNVSYQESYAAVINDQIVVETEQEVVVATTARVKFMITKQDEADLQELGYSDMQIRKMKPQEVADILVAGTPAGPDRELS